MIDDLETIAQSRALQKWNQYAAQILSDQKVGMSFPDGRPRNLPITAGRQSFNKPREVKAMACQTCQDTGTVDYNPAEGITRYCSACEKGRGQAAAAERFYREMKQERQAHARAIIQKRIDTFTTRHEVMAQPLSATLETFLATWTGTQSLLVVGPLGVGKTWDVVALAQRMVDRAVEEDWSMLLVAVPDFLDELRACYDPDRQRGTDRFDEVMERYKRIKLLIFDDWGKEKPSGWVSEQFFKLINHRYNQKLPMFITSNLMPPQLMKEFAAEMDRLKEMCQVIIMQGESRRGKEGK